MIQIVIVYNVSFMRSIYLLLLELDTNTMNFFLRIIILSVITCSCEGGGNPYKVLGVNRHDSPDVIKKTYKKLALKW